MIGRRVSIRNIRTFLAIVDSGSFAAAARSVHRTQSAISAQMQLLEESAGLPLFDRTSRPPRLTEAGRRFAEGARDVLVAYDRLFGGTGPDLEGYLRLGVVPSVVTGLMPRALVAMRARYARLHIQLVTGLSAALVDQVRHDALDAAIINDLPRAGSGLKSTLLMREPLVLIAPPETAGHSPEDLVRSYPFIRYNREAWVGELVNRVLKRHRLRVSEGLVLDTREAIITMVHHGLGISIVPMPPRDQRTGPPVLEVRLGEPTVHRTLCLIELTEHGKPEFTAMLLRELHNILPHRPGMETVRGKRAT